MIKHVSMGVEDCLVLSVFSPNLPQEKAGNSKEQLKPVFFWIHGGGFNMGSGDKDFYGPEKFMDYDIVCRST